MASDPKVVTAAKRARNRAFITKLNARTVCAYCGKQPIEWHNPEHVQLNRKTYRIGNMVTQPANIARIQAELTRCTPLCRRCHMAKDGRLKRFIAMNEPYRQRSLPPKPCSNCSRLVKPLRRGLCDNCYRRHRYQGMTVEERRWVARRRVATATT